MNYINELSYLHMQKCWALSKKDFINDKYKRVLKKSLDSIYKILTDENKINVNNQKIATVYEKTIKYELYLYGIFKSIIKTNWRTGY